MSPASNETISVGALAVRFLVEPDDSGGSVSVFECDVPAEARMPAPHSHDGFEETIYGLEGVSTWTIDGAQVAVRPGEAICIARGAVHGFENSEALHAKFLAIASPGVFGPSYFREVNEVLAAAGEGPPDRSAMIDVMRRHGLTLA